MISFLLFVVNIALVIYFWNQSMMYFEIEERIHGYFLLFLSACNGAAALLYLT